MARLSPCEDPRSWPGANCSMPTAFTPRRARWNKAALPMAPRPTTATSNLSNPHLLPHVASLALVVVPSVLKPRAGGPYCASISDGQGILFMNAAVQPAEPAVATERTRRGGRAGKRAGGSGAFEQPALKRLRIPFAP